MVGAIAVGAGLAGSSFATTLTQRYHPYAIDASVACIIAWLVHLARTSGIHRAGLRQHGRRLARHAVVMGAASGVTLGAALGISTLIQSL